MRIACLGSGSRGNSTLVESGGGALLVDAGFSGVQLARRLEELDYTPEKITEVVITHEHGDHAKGIGVASRKWGWTVHLTAGTAEACATLLRGTESLVIRERDERFEAAGLDVRLVPTCHDAADPVAVCVEEPATGLRAGIATDIGRATAPVREAFRRCHFLLMEANHDEVLLRQAPYPWSLKQRIGGSRGHLSNRLAGELLAELSHRELGGILLAHLSEECNDPTAAVSEVRRLLRRARFGGRLAAARQSGPSPWFDVGRLAELAGADGPQLQLFGTVR